MEKKVMMKWQTEGDLAVLYRIENILVFYTKEKDPYFKNQQEVKMEEVQNTNPYKAIPFDFDSLPSDVIPDLVFGWN